MSRNASGTYALPGGNPVITGTTIASTWANTTLGDLRDEMTDSLSRSGKGGMLAALQLLDGTVIAPGLAFASDLSSGLYRAGANDLRMTIGGVDRLRFTATGAGLTGTGSGLYAADANASLELRGNRNAADTGIDLYLNTAATRTAGSLFGIANNGSSRLLVDTNGAIHIVAPVSGGGAYVVADQTNSGLVIRGNKSATDSGPEVVLMSLATRTAGSLLSVQNNGNEKVRVEYTGTTAINGVLSILDTITVSGATIPQVVLKATSLVGEQRALTIQGDYNHVPSEVAYWSPAGWKHHFYNDVEANGTIGIAGSNIGLYTTSTDSYLTLRGNRSAASPGVDVVAQSAATRTAGKIFSVENNFSERLSVSWDAVLVLGAGMASGSGSYVIGSAPNGQLGLSGSKNAADAGTDVRIYSQATRTAGHLLDVDNAGTTKFAIGYDGTMYQNGVAFTGGAWTTKFATSDQTLTANVTNQDLTGLSFSCASGVTYHVRSYLMLQVNDTTTVLGIHGKATGQPTVSSFRATDIGTSGGSNTLAQSQSTAYSTNFSSHNNGNTANNWAPRLTDWLFTTTSTGTFQIQADNGAGLGYTIAKGSYLEYAIVQ